MLAGMMILVVVVSALNAIPSHRMMSANGEIGLGMHWQIVSEFSNQAGFQVC